MKKFFSSLSFFLFPFFSLMALFHSSLASSHQIDLSKLMELAKKDRYSYNDVVLEIRNRVATFSQVSDYYPYLEQLNELKRIQTDIHKFPVFRESPLKTLGPYLVKGMSKVVEFAYVPQNILQTAFLWGSELTNNEMIQKQEHYLAKKKYSLEETIQLYETSTFAVNFLEATLQNMNLISGEDNLPGMVPGVVEEEERNITYFLVNHAKDLQTKAMQALLKNYSKQLSFHQVSPLFLKLKSPAGLDMALKYFSLEIAETKEEKKLNEIMDQLLLLGEIQGQLNDDRLYLYQLQPGELLTNILLKLINMGKHVDHGTLLDIIHFLQNRDYEQLGLHLQLLSIRDLNPSQLSMVYDLSEYSIKFLEKLNYEKEVLRLKKISHELLLGLKMEENSVEGFYQIRMKSGKTYKMNIIRFGLTDMALAIADDQDLILTNNTYAQFNHGTHNEDQNFVVSSMDTDLETIENQIFRQVSFNFNAAGEIEGTFFDGQINDEFIGKKIDSYPTFIKPDNSAPEAITTPQLPKNLLGVYKGKRGDYSIVLNINLDNSGRLVATMSNYHPHFNGPTINISFARSHFFSETNTIYFLNRHLEANRPFRHLRGQFLNDGVFKGTLIVGGKKESFPLTLIKERL